jgi:membrane dipeptidase
MNAERAEQFGPYDFGLDADGERRAAALHAERVIIDMLFQGPCGYRSFPLEMLEELEREWERTRDLRTAVQHAGRPG